MQRTFKLNFFQIRNLYHRIILSISFIPFFFTCRLAYILDSTHYLFEDALVILEKKKLIGVENGARVRYVCIIDDN